MEHGCAAAWPLLTLPSATSTVNVAGMAGEAGFDHTCEPSLPASCSSSSSLCMCS